MATRARASRVGQSGPAGAWFGGVSSPRAERSGAGRGIKGAGGLRSEVKGDRERPHCAEKRPIVREESPDIRQVHPTAPCPSLEQGSDV